MRKSLAVLAAVGVFGALTASAATLGGLNSAVLGADQTIVASCDTDGINLSYDNSYDEASNSYFTDAVTISDVNAACDGSDFQLTLSDGTSALIEATGSVVTASGSQTIVLSAPVLANSVTAASLVIAN